jgi:hypothetical protein
MPAASVQRIEGNLAHEIPYRNGIVDMRIVVSRRP